MAAPVQWHTCPTCSYTTTLNFRFESHKFAHHFPKTQRFFNCVNSIEPLRCFQCISFETQELVHLKRHFKVDHTVPEPEEKRRRTLQYMHNGNTQNSSKRAQEELRKERNRAYSRVYRLRKKLRAAGQPDAIEPRKVPLTAAERNKAYRLRKKLRAAEQEGTSDEPRKAPLTERACRLRKKLLQGTSSEPKKLPLTDAERCRAYRLRKKLQQETSYEPKKVPLTAAERKRAYRLRKKLLAAEQQEASIEPKKVPLTEAERKRAYRLRKKLQQGTSAVSSIDGVCSNCTTALRVFDCADSIQPFRCIQCTNCETHKLVELRQHFKAVHVPQDTETKLHVCRSCHFQTDSDYLHLKHRMLNRCLFKGNSERLGKHTKAEDIKSKWNLKFINNTSNLICNNLKCDATRWEYNRSSRKQTKSEIEGRTNEHRKDVHDKALKFICDQCGFAAKFKQSLETHLLRKHTNPDDIRWFHCALCSYKGKMKGDRDNHMKYVHDDALNFLCDQCGFAAKYKESLEKHVRRKHGNPEDIEWFRCALCAYKSARKRNRDRHMQSVH